MGHLINNEGHWYLGSPFQLQLTILDVASADLTNLSWVINGVLEIANISASDDINGNAVVTVTVDASDTSSLSEAIYDWQLKASIDGTGPGVIAIGKLRLDPMAAAPAP